MNDIAKHPGRPRQQPGPLRRKKRRSTTTYDIAPQDTSALAVAQKLFAGVMERVQVHWKPIVSWSRRDVMGASAFCQPADDDGGTWDTLVATAEQLGVRPALGRTVRAAVAKAALGARIPGPLFVPISAAELNDFALYSPVPPLSALAPRVALVVTDRARLTDVQGLPLRLTKLRALGYSIALDNVGDGYADLACISQLAPDFILMAPALTAGIDRSPRKRSLVRALVRLCAHDLGIQVVVTGVDDDRAREALVLEGCDLFETAGVAAETRM